MKETTSDFLRKEIARLSEIVVETGIFHPSGVKLHSAGDTLSLIHAKALHDSGLMKLFLLEFGEDERTAKRSLGVEMVLPSRILAGDQLAEDLRKTNGDLVLTAGTSLDPSMQDKIQSASILAVPIRHRGLDAQVKEAEAYLTLTRAAAPPRDLMTRVTRISTPATTSVRYLLIPRARVLVAMADDLLRTLVGNALVSQGHELIERRSAADALRDAPKERPHMVLLDLQESQGVLPRLRDEGGLRRTAILVCADESQTLLIQKALREGANDFLPRPPGRDQLTEKLRGCQAILGRKIQIPPSLRNERRKHPRKAGKVECLFKDPRQGRTQVAAAEVIEASEGGLRVEYNLPTWQCPWAYRVHGIHPKNYFFEFAASNPLGRDLIVTTPKPGGAPVEYTVRAVHLEPAADLEVLGLAFVNGGAPSPPPGGPPTRKF